MRPRNILNKPYLQTEAKGLFNIKFGKGVIPIHERACGGLKHYFDDLESLLTSQADDIDQPKEILREIHQHLEHNDRQILGDVLLQRRFIAG